MSAQKLAGERNHKFSLGGSGFFWDLLRIFLFFLISFISFLIPKKKNLYVFLANESGSFGGNIKPLYMEAFGNKESREIYFLSTDLNTVEFVKELGYQTLAYPSMKSIWTILRANKVIAECEMRIDICAMAMNSKVYQLWHGANLKYIFKQWDKVVKDTKFVKTKILQKIIRKIKTNLPEYRFVLSPSEFYKKNTFSKSFSAKRVFVAGYPRNDLFLRETNELDWVATEQSLIRKAIKHRAAGGRVIIYCPTWRDKASRKDNVNPFPAKFVSFLEQHNILFIVKKHHRDRRSFSEKPHHLIDIYDHSKDVYLLLKHSDMLITDYSSIFFDYLLLDKPVVFYPYDYDVYVSRDRMFQYDYDEFTPGKKCRDITDFLVEIERALDQGSSYYKEARDKIKKMAFELNLCENSSQIIWNEIIND